MSDPLPDDAEMVVLAVHPREERVAVHRGPNTQPYPLVFEGVRGEDLEVDSELRRMWFEMFGWQWVMAEQGTDDAEVIEQTVLDLQEGADLLEAFRDGAIDLGGTECLNCEHVFDAEGSDSILGPTCPKCGHPAEDLKVVR